MTATLAKVIKSGASSRGPGQEHGSGAKLGLTLMARESLVRIGDKEDSK